MSKGYRRKVSPLAVAAKGDSTTANPLPPDRHPPVTDGLTLWLSADGAIRRGSRDRVEVWEDMLTGDNHKAQNATQFTISKRPRWFANAIGGKPAVRFDGDDVLLLATPSNLGLLNQPYDIFVVAQTASPEIQFLIAGGVEDFELHLNGDAGARYIPAGYLAGTGASDLQATGSYADGRPHVFAVRVAADEDRHGIVTVDGLDSADVTAGDARSVNNTSLRLGMRHDGTLAFRGEVAEILIFHRTLTAQQRQRIGRYLSTKYGIEARY